tara:strand:- start:835 stop:1578 length:744 start_codon:yes stop_codon:yes gene_type:complete
METLLSSISIDQEENIHKDIHFLDTMADVFLNTHNTDDAIMFRHLGNELHHFSARLTNKINDITQKLQDIEHKLNDHDSKIITRMISSLTPLPNTQIDRAEDMLPQESFGFVPISSHDLNERINIKNEMLSPVICLWEQSLHQSKGKVQSALRNFVNTIETRKGEFTDILMEISSSVKHFDHLQAKENLKTLGQWSFNLSESDADNLKAAESAIALASYVIGDNNIYTQTGIVNEIQKRHHQYLNNV